MKLLNQDSEFVNEMNQPKWYKELQRMIYLQSVQQGPMELTVRPNALLQLMESSAVKLGVCSNSSCHYVHGCSVVSS